MLNQSQAVPSIIVNKSDPVAHPVPDAFGFVTGHAGLIATEFSYRKDEEIYGEDEPAEYVYQVISGAVRSYKLLSDGRRQIGRLTSHPFGRRVSGLFRLRPLGGEAGHADSLFRRALEASADRAHPSAAVGWLSARRRTGAVPLLEFVPFLVGHRAVSQFSRAPGFSGLMPR